MKKYFILILFLFGCSDKGIKTPLVDQSPKEKVPEIEITESIIKTEVDQLTLRTTEVCSDTYCDIYAIISIGNNKQGYKLKALEPTKDQIQDFTEVNIKEDEILTILNKKDADKKNEFNVNLNNLANRLKLRTYLDLDKCRSVNVYKDLVEYATNKAPFINLHFPSAFERDKDVYFTNNERIVLNFNLKQKTFNKISLFQSAERAFSSFSLLYKDNNSPDIIWLPNNLDDQQKLNFGKTLVRFAADCSNSYEEMNKPYSSNRFYHAEDDIEPSRDLESFISSHELSYDVSYFSFVTKRSSYSSEQSKIIISSYQEYKEYFDHIDDQLKEKINEVY
ncbi:MAG: hypothetical protein MK008_00190 [Bdellovibrionales bacterium]|nr:hypothetical protein [Bdellovibrionales bacterium]